jgi:hypothetical protein
MIGACRPSPRPRPRPPQARWCQTATTVRPDHQRAEMPTDTASRDAPSHQQVRPQDQCRKADHKQQYVHLKIFRHVDSRPRRLCGKALGTPCVGGQRPTAPAHPDDARHTCPWAAEFWVRCKLGRIGIQRTEKGSSYRQSFDADKFCEFLQALIKDAGKKVFRVRYRFLSFASRASALSATASGFAFICCQFCQSCHGRGFWHSPLQQEKSMASRGWRRLAIWHRHCSIGHASNRLFAAPPFSQPIRRKPSMKIAITSQNRKTITEHAGMCRKFWVYEVQNQSVVSKVMVELEKDQSFHELAHSDRCATSTGWCCSCSLQVVPGVVCSCDLAQRGIRGSGHHSTQIPDQAVAAWLKGELGDFLPSQRTNVITARGIICTTITDCRSRSNRTIRVKPAANLAEQTCLGSSQLNHQCTNPL